MLVISKSIDNWRAKNIKGDQVQTESFRLLDRRAYLDVILRSNNSIPSLASVDRLSPIGSAILKPKVNLDDLTKCRRC